MKKFFKGIHPKRFWTQVEYNLKTGCWEWQGYTIKRNGYGRFMCERKNPLAHRYAYEQLVGPIPEGIQVCHRCDVPKCVRPDHLFLGTNSDNVRDALRKGRRKDALPLDVVKQIQALLAEGWGAAAISTRLGVKRYTVANMINSGTWDWL